MYDKLVSDGTVVPKPEVHPPTVPMDYSWAQVISTGWPQDTRKIDPKVLCGMRRVFFPVKPETHVKSDSFSQFLRTILQKGTFLWLYH